MFLDGSLRAPSLLLVAGFFSAASAIINDHSDYAHYQHQQQMPVEHYAKGFYRDDIKDALLKPHQRFKPIAECMFVTSESGPFVYTAENADEKVCGVYFLTDPDRKIEIHFLSFDVPCDQEGLVAVVDGWELNGQVFPSETDHRLSLKQRSNEFCGKNIARTFTSSQNAAVIQYRVPKRGKGFTVFATYPKNPTPCNVLSVSLTEPFTLRNYGRRINCTYTAIYQSTVHIIALDVGVANLLGSVQTTETGTLRKCDERNPHDQVQIGGSEGLDTSKIQVLDSICGMDSKPNYRESVDFEVSSVRLISSGFFDNSVTVNMLPNAKDILESDLSL